ncbi:putative enterotoxin [Ophiocordyceps unilateralis]|uniref:Enterotoxin n=1 Tax=Ophiocordyceps unilateralis TaxID=268505 RepID=A0A2A9PJR0_OPHUN|nr:putative enterotoxin [Ophiocordyceps unilateralis]
MIPERWALAIVVSILPWTNAGRIPTSSIKHPSISLPEFVYRGDGRSPEEIQAAGGFVPWGQPSTSEAYSIFNHEKGEERNVNSVFVSTSAKFGVARIYASRNNGVVYRIRATPNMIDVEGTMGQHYDGAIEAEFAAMGGIRWDQVHSYWKASETSSFGDTDEFGSLDNADYELISSQFEANGRYNVEKYGQSVASAGQPQLAGFHQNHPALNQEPWSTIDQTVSTHDYAKRFALSIGAPDGWLEQYPLFAATNLPQEISDKTAEGPPPLPAKKGKGKPMLEHSKESPQYVFRGSSISPERMREEGFIPPSRDYTPAAFSLTNHLNKVTNHETKMQDTVYVSTTKVFGVAGGSAKAGNWVYQIHVSPNMIGVQDSLGKYCDEALKAEFLALGGIRWSQVKGWVHLPDDYIPPGERQELTLNEGFDTLEKSPAYTLNPEYDAEFEKFTASSGAPQLAGFAVGHPALREKPWADSNPALGKSTKDYAMEFMQSIGAPQGWTDKFPMFGEDREMAEMEEKRRQEREEQEKEKKDREQREKEKKEREEKERKEREEKERKEREEKERKEREEKERKEREEEEKKEREKKAREERERQAAEAKEAAVRKAKELSSNHPEDSWLGKAFAGLAVGIASTGGGAILTSAAAGSAGQAAAIGPGILTSSEAISVSAAETQALIEDTIAEIIANLPSPPKGPIGTGPALEPALRKRASSTSRAVKTSQSGQTDDERGRRLRVIRLALRSITMDATWQGFYDACKKISA